MPEFCLTWVCADGVRAVQGKGTFFGNDGELYEGEFKNGMRYGRGKQSVGGRAVDGFGATVYEGEWVDDMK